MGRRPKLDDDDDVERQAPHAHGDPDFLHYSKTQQPAGRRCFGFCMIVTISLVVTACVVAPILYYRGDAHYSVAIDSASGLDPTTGVSFNLTLGITSHSYGSKACVNPGMYAEVSYHGVQLATSPVEAERLCAGPGKAAERRVVAMATGVPLGHVMDSLVADMEQDGAVFDVALHIPAGSYGWIASFYGEKWVSTCEGRRVGVTAAPCDSPDQDEFYA